MATAQAVTNEQGHFFNKTYKVGLAGHGGMTASCYSSFKLKDSTRYNPIKRLEQVELDSPAAYKELLKVVPAMSKAQHEIAYVIKTNKEGKKYHSVLGQYISFKVGKAKISTLIKGYSCIFFINDKRVTFLPKSLKE